MDTHVSAGANTPRLTEAVGSIGPRGWAKQHPDLVGCGQADEAALVFEDEVVVDVIGGELDVAAPGRGRPSLPIFAPETLANTACPSVVAKNSTMWAGLNSSSTRFHRPVGMPDPMNRRTGWLPFSANDGSSMTSRSIAHVYDTTVTPYCLISCTNRSGCRPRDRAMRVPPTTAPPRLTSSPD